MGVGVEDAERDQALNIYANFTSKSSILSISVTVHLNFDPFYTGPSVEFNKSA